MENNYKILFKENYFRLCVEMIWVILKILEKNKNELFSRRNKIYKNKH